MNPILTDNAAESAAFFSPARECARQLVVMPSWIGDTLMAHPLLTRLHRTDQPIDALAPRWVAPLLTRMPEIDQIIEAPFTHGELALAARHALARRLSGVYRRAYVLPNSFKSALVPFLARIPERVGFTGEARYGLINRRHTLDKVALPQLTERFAQLAEPPGSPLPRPLPSPRLLSSPEEQARALQDLNLPPADKRVIFCPGAEYGPAKRWPARHFAALADALAHRGYSICLLGSPRDRATGDEIVRLCAAAFPDNLCGQTSLIQAIDLIAASRCVVCNDSGLMHVAAALDRPLVALYGSSSPLFTPPHSEQARILSLNLPCAPCFKRTCPRGHLDCLNTLDPSRVFEACVDLMCPAES